MYMYALWIYLKTVHPNTLNDRYQVWYHVCVSCTRQWCFLPVLNWFSWWPLLACELPCLLDRLCLRLWRGFFGTWSPRYVMAFWDRWSVMRRYRQFYKHSKEIDNHKNHKNIWHVSILLLVLVYVSIYTTHMYLLTYLTIFRLKNKVFEIFKYMCTKENVCFTWIEIRFHNIS